MNESVNCSIESYNFNSVQTFRSSVTYELPNVITDLWGLRKSYYSLKHNSEINTYNHVIYLEKELCLYNREFRHTNTGRAIAFAMFKDMVT